MSGLVHINCPVYLVAWRQRMKRTEWLQETRKMRFEEAYDGWQGNRLTQEEAAQILGVVTGRSGAM